MPPSTRSTSGELCEALKDSSFVDSITKALMPSILTSFKENLLTTITDFINNSLKPVIEENVNLKRQLEEMSLLNTKLTNEVDASKNTQVDKNCYSLVYSTKNVMYANALTSSHAPA